MKRIFLFTGFFLCLCLLAPLPVFAEAGTANETVTVLGEAPIFSGNRSQARTQAVNNALRAAVEKGVGTLVDSKTRVENFTVLEDKIYSRAKGYVTGYDILHEGPTPDGSTYAVTMRASVRTADIGNDLRAVGILMAQVGNPRFMAVYLPRTQDSASRETRVVQAAGQALDAVFLEKGFVVLDQTFVDQVYQEIERAGRIEADEEELSALALKYRADLLLVYDVAATEKTGGQSAYFGGVLVEMSLKAVAPATGDLIGVKRGDSYARTLKSGGDAYGDAQAAKATEEVGRALALALVPDVLSYFERSVQAGGRYDLWFRNFSEEEIYTIVDAIEAMNGFVDKNVRDQSPGNFQMDVQCRGKKFDFQRELYQGLKKEGISFDTQQAKGNRFLFFKKGTANPYGEPKVY